MSLPQQPTDEVFRFAFAQVHAGVRPFDVQRQLVANGWDPQTAAYVMNHVRQTLQQHSPMNSQPANPTAPQATAAATQRSPAPGNPQVRNDAFVHNVSSAQPPLAPFQNASPSSGTAGNSTIRRSGKIPWSVYRDLVIGGTFLFVGVAMAAARFQVVASVFAILFGLIQIIRGAIIAALSQYKV